MAMTNPGATSTCDGDALESLGGRKVKFEIGDTVQVGTRVGRITDIGTVLIQVKTNDGGFRMACPWEVVRIRRCHEGRLRV
jgi:small-conductance mechanosensitive channel